MDLLDILLLLVVVAYAASGYRRGLVAGCVSLAGFVGGAVLGVWILPWMMDLVTPGTTRATVTAVLTVLVPAAVGHELAGRLALRLRRELGRASLGPLRVADGVGGAAANSVAVLLVAWVAASVLGASSSPLLTTAIRDSALLGAVQNTMPDTTPAWFSRATSALTQAGFPQVFNPFENESTAEVAKPTGDSVTASATNAAKLSTVKIEGVSGDQGREGSGFVYARDHVMTNAHVVAGIDDPSVRIGGVGRSYEARVVLFDPDKDVAVLYVPGLGAPVLKFDDSAARGDSAVVAGYPQDGDLNLQAATVANRVQANGQNIYGDAMVTREIYSIRSTVRPGNSGGPLLTTDGRVYGVVFARSTSDNETGYVLTAAEVASDARRAAKSTAAVDTGDLVTS